MVRYLINYYSFSQLFRYVDYFRWFKKYQLTLIIMNLPKEKYSNYENIASTRNKVSNEMFTDAVIEARRLICPVPKARHTHECDHKYYQWWEKNDKIIKQAWKDYPFKHEQLRYFNKENESLFIQQDFLDVVNSVRAGKKNEEDIRLFFDEPIPGVFRTNQIFTPTFLKMMLEEIDHKNEAGIPLQRPNSMNRFGVILKVCCNSIY